MVPLSLFPRYPSCYLAFLFLFPFLIILNSRSLLSLSLLLSSPLLSSLVSILLSSCVFLKTSGCFYANAELMLTPSAIFVHAFLSVCVYVCQCVFVYVCMLFTAWAYVHLNMCECACVCLLRLLGRITPWRHSQ